MSRTYKDRPARVKEAEWSERNPRKRPPHPHRYAFQATSGENTYDYEMYVYGSYYRWLRMAYPQHHQRRARERYFEQFERDYYNTHGETNDGLPTPTCFYQWRA